MSDVAWAHIENIAFIVAVAFVAAVWLGFGRRWKG